MTEDKSEESRNIYVEEGSAGVKKLEEEVGLMNSACYISLPSCPATPCSGST
jgi:hypothetical protein